MNTANNDNRICTLGLRTCTAVGAGCGVGDPVGEEEEHEDLLRSVIVCVCRYLSRPGGWP